MTAISRLIWSMLSGGTSNTMASLYTGFRVLRLVDVFLFFSLRPSHIRDTFTYGSEKRKGVKTEEIIKQIYTH